MAESPLKRVGKAFKSATVGVALGASLIAGCDEGDKVEAGQQGQPLLTSIAAAPDRATVDHGITSTREGSKAALDNPEILPPDTLTVTPVGETAEDGTVRLMLVGPDVSSLSKAIEDDPKLIAAVSFISTSVGTAITVALDDIEGSSAMVITTTEIISKAEDGPISVQLVVAAQVEDALVPQGDIGNLVNMPDGTLGTSMNDDDETATAEADTERRR